MKGNVREGKKKDEEQSEAQKVLIQKGETRSDGKEREKSKVDEPKAGQGQTR